MRLRRVDVLLLDARAVLMSVHVSTQVSDLNAALSGGVYGSTGATATNGAVAKVVKAAVEEVRFTDKQQRQPRDEQETSSLHATTAAHVLTCTSRVCVTERGSHPATHTHIEYPQGGECDVLRSCLLAACACHGIWCIMTHVLMHACVDSRSRASCCHPTNIRA